MTFTPLVLTDAEIYMGGLEATLWSSKLELGAEAEDLDRTTFASQGWRERNGGTFDGALDLEGFRQATDRVDYQMPDDTFWASLGVHTVPVTALPSGGAVGDLSYLTRALEVAYAAPGEHGQNLKTKVTARTNWPITRGRILHPNGTARTTTGNGTSQQIGAVDASHALYVCLHVLNVADPAATLTVKVQSDNATGFPSPTDQATFTAASAPGGQTARIVGAITDDWWRVTWTIAGGSSPSFLFAVSAGIAVK